MSNLKLFLFFGILLPVMLSCENSTKENTTKQIKEKKVVPPVKSAIAKKNKEIFLQPFTDLPAQRATYIYKHLKELGLPITLLPAVDLPSLAYYKPRNRYRADSLIYWLGKRISSNQLVAGLTSKDISTTKGTNPDSGIFGLGYVNGPSCVISTFRLHSDEQVFKTVIHELGHNFGLPHCSVKTCFMRDAEGKNTTSEEKEFCPSCKGILTANGWKLP